MSTRLKEYVANRLKDPKAVSSVERDLLSTVDRYRLSGRVKLLYIDEERFEVYSAAINTDVAPVRISISSDIVEGHHGLNSVFEASPDTRRQRDSLFTYDPTDGCLIFDDYFKRYSGLEAVFDKIESLLTATGIQKTDCVILAGSVFTERALLYVLERNAAKVVFSAHNGEEVSMLRRIEISSNVSLAKTGLAFPMNNVLGLILNRKDVYVPIDDATLESEFCNGISWKALLGPLAEESENDVMVNGMRCRILRLTPYVDGFGDLFIDMWSPIDRRQRHVLVLGPAHDRKFGLVVEEDPAPDTTYETPDIQETTLPEEIGDIPDAEPETWAALQPQTKPRQQEAPEGNPRRKGPSDAKKAGERKPVKSESKKPSKYIHDIHLGSDTIVLLDGREFHWRKVNEKIPSMGPEEVDEALTVINGVFSTMLKSSKIVTDTNLWVTEQSSKQGEMAYRPLIEYFLDKNKKLVYEIMGVVYEEIYRLDQQKKAAANKAKMFIDTQDRLGRIELVDMRLGANPHAYADKLIGERVLQLYEEGVNFSILTNDTDASIRWRAKLKERQKALNRPTLPPMILCRELHTLYRMRGKLIARRTQLNSNKK